MQVVGGLILGLLLSIQAFMQSENASGMVQNLTEASGNLGQYAILLSLLCALASGTWCGILYWRSDWRVRPFDYRKAFPLKRVFMIAATVSGACILLTFFLGLVQQLAPAFFKDYNQLMETISTGDMFLNILYVVTIGPISEELIFRGALFDRFYLVFPFWTANILQALLFGIYHMNVIQGFYAFLLGILLGMVRQMTGSILATIFSHMIFNGTTYAISYILTGAGAYAGIVLMGMVVLSVVAVVFGSRMIWRSCTKNL
ncbi:MAG: CPBP family intramembrane metalloprotease [Lachnospiraceae bacterium]|nr:CPBP family intramembrane metalloprotease [Lachnospiraceae bacterium]